VPLVVCGDGPLRTALEARAAKIAPGRALFTGHLGKSDLDEVVARAAAVALPSIAAENAPYTVLESMGAGVPVIVSNAGGLPELAASGGGVVFKAGSAAELAARIREVWENPALAREMGAKGKRFVSEELREDRHIARLEDVYQKAIAPR
jgi:glycosyltransferase involved in cell wall biosynthesis